VNVGGNVVTLCECSVDGTVVKSFGGTAACSVTDVAMLDAVLKQSCGWNVSTIDSRAVDASVAHAMSDAPRDRSALIRARAAKQLPKTVLTDVYWSFHEPGYKDRAAFAAAAAEYNAEMDGTWEPEQVAIPVTTIRIAIDVDDDAVTLRSTSPIGFTVADLLHQLHATFRRSLAESDHHFFEGLELDDETTPPLYIMSVGS